ncbi:hypothetical protein GCK72_001510 [Caenorhabditis remanei]|uniref:B30.2/SPRY domain-containing protein n=1 Tax=Caenorhabditis remanei TaxID=31234 RepID=A0A6A5HTZ0_CAERE|nr:hypothetical protein GCK72_001510 [Caenorhabditis remanei]KAF1769693.1 hypothetical protein GCK72_001510 [Caenorhabditis remanei]
MQAVPPSKHNEDLEKHLTPHEFNETLRILYPHIRERENDVRLPRRWDATQASSYLELHPNGFSVNFKRNASIQGDKDPSGVVRADFHIPASVGTYYFEVSILHGHRGCMGVGLSKQGGELNRMPGWDPHCYGYHGDDGNFFSACGHGTAYGPKFGTGDVIGCGIDTTLNMVFFTKNGKHLGVALECKPGELEDLYPTVGLKTPGERLVANFGQTEFMFDFDGYRDILNNKKIRMLEDVKVPPNFGNHMDRVVASFLAHTGATETLKSFSKVAKLDRPIDHEFVRKRKEKLLEYFPGCLQNQNRVQLIFLCLRYIDLANTMQKAPPSFRSSIDEHQNRPISPTEIRAKPPKLLKGNHCKSTKRTRESQKKQSNPKVHTPPPVRRTDAKATEDLCIKNSNIDRFYTDEDTGEEMISIDGLNITKRMYVELYTSDEYGKLSYIIKLGREIMRLAGSVENQLTKKDRQILETSMMMVLCPNPLEKYPLKASDRRYISNVIKETINNYAPSTPSKPSKPVNEKEKEKKKDGKNKEKKEKEVEKVEKVEEKETRKIYSELRGLFLAWKGIHYDLSSRDGVPASIYFMRNMVLDELKFPEKPIEYSDEPMEQEASEAPERTPEPVREVDNGMVMEEDDDELDEEEEDV